MEMRTILANVFHKYHFELSEPYKNFDAKKAGYGVENFQATMGPRDLTPEGLEATKRRADNNQTPQMAMYLKVTPGNHRHGYNAPVFVEILFAVPPASIGAPPT